MGTADGSAFVLARHSGVPRGEVARVLATRWPGAVIGDAASAEPSWRFAPEHAAELARVRRGVEPLRIVVPEQRAAVPESGAAIEATAKEVEPMPVVL